MRIKILPFLILSGIVLIVTEALCRVLNIPTPPTPDYLSEHSLHYQPALFSRLTFPQSIQDTTVTFPKSGEVHYRINSLGYRGREFTEEKPPGEIRIIIYGGSSVFDIANSEGADWPSRTEEILHSEGFPQVHVINAGIPGLASFDALGLLFAEGHRLKPDYVIFSGMWNDIKFFQNEKSLLRSVSPSGIQKNPLEITYGPLDRFLSSYSKLYNTIRASILLNSLDLQLEGIPPRAPKSPGLQAEALEQYRLSLTSLVDFTRTIGAQPILMTEPHLASSELPKSERHKLLLNFVHLSYSELLDAYKVTEGILHDTAQKKNTLLIDASIKLSGDVGAFLDHVHTSPQGSKTLASITAQTLLPILALTSEQLKRYDDGIPGQISPSRPLCEPDLIVKAQ